MKAESKYPIEDLKAIHIAEEAVFPTSLFTLPDWPRPYLKSVMIPSGLIKDRVEKITQDIYKAYRKEEKLTFVIMMTVN